jgi:imidazolonepropionase-like amidohydrolase
MKRLLVLLLAIPVHLLSQSSITLRHINVVDVRTGDIKHNQVVSIKGNKIASIGGDNQKSRKSIGQEVDAKGKFLIPGLWDMHTHIVGNLGDRKYYNEFATPVFLANGITGIRNMWGSRAEVLMRDSIERNLLVTPRLIVSTPIVDGPAVFHQGALPISNISQVPVVVDSMQALGYDFLKVYSLMPRDIFFALAKYCRQKNFPIAGHVPFGVTAEEASAAGLQSIEHSTGLSKSFTDNEEKLSRRWEQEVRDTSGFLAHLDIFDRAEMSTLTPFNKAKAKTVAATLVRNRTAVVPTLVLWAGYTKNRDSLMKIPALAYVPKGQQQQWYDFRGIASPGKDFSIQSKLEQVNFLHKQGVLILAGSDCLNPFTVHGFSLHEELELFVKAGLTPLQALRTATLNPAVFLKREAELGMVEKGKLADLIILEKNPLEDIKNTRSIYAVIMNGYLMDKTKINQFLEQLKERASK